MDDELWCDDVEVFRETSPVMGEDVITTWLAGMSVYNDPVREGEVLERREGPGQGGSGVAAERPVPAEGGRWTLAR